MEQSRGIPLKKKRFLLRDSDRSGFTYRSVELVNDNGSLVGGDEFDAPPPSNRLYPGEGDVSPGDTRSNYTDYTNQPATQNATQILKTSDTISLKRETDNSGQYTYTRSTVYVSGSNATTRLTSNPQIAASDHGDFLCVQGAGSSVILVNGSGLRLYTTFLKLDSGTQVNFIYDATNGLWCETSRMNPNFSLTGEF